MEILEWWDKSHKTSSSFEDVGAFSDSKAYRGSINTTNQW